MNDPVTREEFDALKQQVEDVQMGDLRFQQRCYQQFSHLHKQLAEQDQSIKELKIDVAGLKEGQQLTNNMLGQVLGLLQPDT